MSRLNLILCLTVLLVAGSAAAQSSYTCIAMVATNDGKATLGTKVVTGATATEAASACHAFTRQAFTANVNWSDPAKVCSRYPSGTVRRIEALDRFKEFGAATSYNRVGGYTVVCNGPAGLTQLPTAPVVVTR